MKTQYDDIEPYTTKDGSTIRELMHPTRHGNRNQSLAEAIVPVGSKTLLHSHQQTEELYHITAGSGVMTVGEEEFPVVEGDTICITPVPRTRSQTREQSPSRSCAAVHLHTITKTRNCYKQKHKGFTLLHSTKERRNLPWQLILHLSNHSRRRLLLSKARAA